MFFNADISRAAFAVIAVSRRYLQAVAVSALIPWGFIQAFHAWFIFRVKDAGIADAGIMHFTGRILVCAAFPQEAFIVHAVIISRAGRIVIITALFEEAAIVYTKIILFAWRIFRCTAIFQTALIACRFRIFSRREDGNLFRLPCTSKKQD